MLKGGEREVEEKKMACWFVKWVSIGNLSSQGEVEEVNGRLEGERLFWSMYGLRVR